MPGEPRRPRPLTTRIEKTAVVASVILYLSPMGRPGAQTISPRDRTTGRRSRPPDGNALGPEDLLELLPAGRAEGAVEIARLPAADRQREAQLGRVEIGPAAVVVPDRPSTGGRLPHRPLQGQARAGESERAAAVPSLLVGSCGERRLLEADPPRLAPQDEPPADRQLLAFAEPQEGGHVVVRDVAEAAGDLAEEFPGHAPGQRGQEEGQGLQVQLDGPAPAQDELVEELADEAVEELVVLAHDAGQAGQVGDDLRLVATGQLRQELGPDAIAQETAVAVRSVLAERPALRLEPGPQVRPGQAEQGPDDRAGRAGDQGRDPGQPGEARATHQAHEDGFGLVGHRVAGGDLGRSPGRRGPPQEAVPQLAPGLLEIDLLPGRVRPDVGGPDRQRQDPAAGQVPHEALVPAGLVPQPVVEMGQADLERHLVAELQEEGGQGDGIRAAGEGDQDAVAGPDERPVEGRSLEGGEDTVGGRSGWHGRVQVMRARSLKNGGGGI